MRQVPQPEREAQLVPLARRSRTAATNVDNATTADSGALSAGSFGIPAFAPAGNATTAVGNNTWKTRNILILLASPVQPGRLAMSTRREHDLLGDRDVPADAYYGVHTLRAVENFPITGTPISIQLGEGYGPDGTLEVSADFLTRDGAEVEACLITAASYIGRNDAQTQAGKDGLARIGAAVILPREPLAPGHYKVALKEAGKLYEWGFTVAAPATR